MKTIFIFNDSRPTDAAHPVVALGEDGELVARIKFDGFTLPHCKFVMGTTHFLRCDDPDISDPVLVSRANVLERYTAVYGADNWMPLWLDAPRSNPDWCVAMHMLRARAQHAQIDSDAAAGRRLTTSRLLCSIFATPVAISNRTH